VNDVSKLVGIKKFADHHGVAAVAQHTDFHGGYLAIIYQHFQLRAQFRAWRVMNGLHALCILHGERGDGCNAVAAVRAKVFKSAAVPRRRRSKPAMVRRIGGAG